MQAVSEHPQASSSEVERRPEDPEDAGSIPALPARPANLLVPERLALDRTKLAFQPVEGPDGYFRTVDGAMYQRVKTTGTIRRVIPKVRGKAARAEDKRARREAKEREARRAAHG